MSTIRTPYRYDFVGSFLRPQALKDAKAAYQAGKITKEELDKIKAEQAETEHSEAVNRLRDYVVKSGRFTEEEIASEEVQKAINELNETWLKSEIADRLVASLAEQKSKKTEVSEVKETKSTLSVVLSENEKSATPDDILRVFFNRKD